MSGFQPLIMFVTFVSFGDPSAPSPAAATTSGPPGPAAGTGVFGDHDFVFTGGDVIPLLNVRLIDAWADAKPSRMSASTSRRAAPSTKSVVERVNVYGFA